MDWTAWIAVIRDISIILLALGSFVLVLVLVFIAWKVYRLVGTAMGKTEEMMALGQGVIRSAQQTADTAAATATSVKGSAEFVADTVVSPVVQVMSAVAGARGFASALFRLSSRQGNGGRK